MTHMPEMFTLEELHSWFLVKNISSKMPKVLIFKRPDGAFNVKSVGHDVYLNITYDLIESVKRYIWNDTLESDPESLWGKTLSYGK